jgi:hypothetical protein
MFVDGHSSGNVTHLGQFTVEYEVAVNLVSVGGLRLLIAWQRTETASSLKETVRLLHPRHPVSLGGVETYTITGGTGRFAGARGSLALDYVVDTTTGVTSGIIQGNKEAQPRLLCHLHHNSFIAHPEYVTLRADVVGRLKLGLSADQT